MKINVHMKLKVSQINGCAFNIINDDIVDTNKRLMLPGKSCYILALLSWRPFIDDYRVILVEGQTQRYISKKAYGC